MFHVEFFGPFLHALGLAVVGNLAVATAIALLFRHGCPTYVAGAIIAVIFDPIQGITFYAETRELGNISMESFKIMHPFITDRDSAPSVEGVHVAFGIGATCLHALPGFVESAVSHAVGCELSATNFTAQTATRTSFASHQAFKNNTSRIATVTLAQPYNLSAKAGNRAKRNEPAKPKSCNICGVFMSGYKIVVHENLPFSCHATGRLQRRGGNFIGCYQSILAQMSENCYV